MEATITGVKQNKIEDYFLIFLEMNGIRFESISIHKREEIKQIYKLTDQEFNKLIKN